MSLGASPAAAGVLQTFPGGEPCQVQWLLHWWLCSSWQALAKLLCLSFTSRTGLKGGHRPVHTSHVFACNAATPCQALVASGNALCAGSPQLDVPQLSAPALLLPNPPRGGNPCSTPYALSLNRPPQPPGSLTAEVLAACLAFSSIYLPPFIEMCPPCSMSVMQCTFHVYAACCPCPIPNAWPARGRGMPASPLMHC